MSRPTLWWMHFVSGLMISMGDLIDIEVVYTEPQKQVIKCLEVPNGSTVGAGIALSCIEDDFPNMNLDTLKIGVFGRIVKKEDVLQARDRIEIYRALLVDPKEARRRRAKKVST
jgi:putative ubiquitin-RnfH superfamily antitoxin RatB of RatAB toxin-antitoxin module